MALEKKFTYPKEILMETESNDVMVKKLIKRSIPPKYVDLEFYDKEILESLINTEKSIFIHGKVGIGKTVLMASVIKDYIKKNNYQAMSVFEGDHRSTNAEWISYPAFIMKLQQMFRNNKENPYDYATEIANCSGLLAIDDLGAEKITDFVRQITYFIINEREQREKRMIITSNYSLNQIDEMIDSRISSRIVGMCDIVELTGADRRIKRV